MPKNPPQFSGGFGYGPVPDNDVPFDGNPGGDHYEDGYHDRYPAGSRGQNPSDYWLDCMIYPDRPRPTSDADADRFDAVSKHIGISLGNATGQKPGPSEE